MKRFSKAAFLISIAFGLGAKGAQAQDQEENSKPKPAARAIVFDANQEPEQTPEPDALRPDTSPLTGVQPPGVGTPVYRHSYWVPGVQLANTLQGSGGSWSDTFFAAGNVSLLEAWAHSHLAVNYSGGGYFSANGYGNGTYQQLTFAQGFEYQRWQLQFFDDFSYLPTTSFGFGGLSNIGVPGVGGSLSPGVPNIGGPYLPNQNVLTSSGPRFSNSFAVQTTYQATRRSSFTLVGSYGFLKFVDPGNIDNADIIGSIGYNYVLSKKDTVGLLYRFTGYHYTGFNQAIGDHVVSAVYGRRITGRMGLSLYAGPEYTTFRVPILGTGDHRFNAAFGGNVNYAFERGGLTIGYDHGTNGGGGVLVGGYGDNLNVGATRQVRRQWSARGNFGYGRIHAFKTTDKTGKLVDVPSYNSYYLGAGLDHPLGRNALLSFGYTAYIQSLNAAACGTACAGSYTQHQFAVGFQWHTRPFVLR